MRLLAVFLAFFISLIQCSKYHPGLYGNYENILVSLNNENYKQILFNQTSDILYFVEFYAHWCGSCKRYAPKWIDLAQQTINWHKKIIKFAVLNCGDPLNGQTCGEFNIEMYPTVRLFPLRANFSPPLHNAIEFDPEEKDLFIPKIINYIEEVEDKPTNWPSLEPYSNFDQKIAFLIVEKEEESLIGREVILDLSDQNVTIRRTTPKVNPKLLENFDLNLERLPSVLVIQNNGQEKFSYISIDLKNKSSQANGDYRKVMYDEIRRYLHIVPDFESSTLVKNFTSNLESFTNQNNNLTKASMNMRDLETGLSTILRYEIPHFNVIQGDEFVVLKNWIHVLSKFFPGRQEVRNYLGHLNTKLLTSEHITKNEWLKMVNENQTSESFLPEKSEWVHCKGSKPDFRGFPCSLWTLFHTLTITQIEHENSKNKPFDENFNVLEVFESIRSFVKFFFRCSECSKNFQKETYDYLEHLKQPHDAVLYLWKVHNRVNKRLADDITTDPAHPKIQFPSRELCSVCYNETGEFREDEVFKFLSNFYSGSKMAQALEKFSISKNKFQELKSENELILNHENSSKKNHSTYSMYLILLAISVVGLAFIFVVRRSFKKY